MASPTDPPPERSASPVQAEYTYDGFKIAFDAYLSGDGSLAQVREQIELTRRARWQSTLYLEISFKRYTLERGHGPLSESELRVMDVGVAAGYSFMLLEAVVLAKRADQLDRIRAHLTAQGLDEHVVLKGIAGLLIDIGNNVGRATELGQGLLSYLPDHLNEILPYLPNRKKPHAALMRLLLAADPPLVESALYVARHVPREQIGHCTLRLLEVAPERAMEWAREVAGPQSPTRMADRYNVLAQLLSLDAHRHLDLAYEAIQAPHADLACLGMIKVYAADTVHGRSVVEDAALHATYTLGECAVWLLKRADSCETRSTLQRCVEEARSPGVRIEALMALAGSEWEGRDAYLCTLLAHRTARIRKAAVAELAQRGEPVLSLITPFLAHPKAQTRLAAAWALLIAGGDRGQALVNAHLRAERSQVVRQGALLVPPLEPMYPPQGRLETPEAVVREARVFMHSGQWAGARLVPHEVMAVRWLTGERMPTIAIEYLLYRQHSSPAWTVQIDERAQQILALVEPATVSDLARAIFNTWLSLGAPMEEQWWMPLVGALADMTLAQDVFDQVWTFEWGDRIRLMQRMPRVLALCGDEVIFSQISDIANAIKYGYSMVASTAQWTLRDVAHHLQIPPEEFLDRAATRPEWGTSRTYVYDYGSCTYTAQFASNLLWHIRDDAGIRLRTIPEPSYSSGNTHAIQAHGQWMARREQTRLAVRVQAARLEDALVAERTWSVRVWQEIFLHHPLMRLLATNLVWAVGNLESGEIAATFRPTDDEMLVASDGQSVELPADGTIWLLHPLHADNELLQTWAAHLRRTRRRPPFRQLDRPVVRICPEERDAIAWTPYEGCVANGKTFAVPGGYHRRRLEKWNYSRRWMLLPWKASPGSLAALVEWLFPSASNAAGERKSFWQLVFQPESVSTHQWRYLSTSEVDATKSLRLSEVPPLVFSEAAAELALTVGPR